MQMRPICTHASASDGNWAVIGDSAQLGTDGMEVFPQATISVQQRNLESPVAPKRARTA